MPELPEVEVAARNLRRWALGRTVRAVSSHGAQRIFRPQTSRAAARLAGARITDVNRVGKNLLLTLRQASQTVGVWSHLGMTGKWLRSPDAAAPPRFARVSLTLDDDRSLHYCDMRLFGRFQVVTGGEFSAVPELAGLGPDPLNDGIDAAALHRRLQRLAVPIKIALLDQRLLAGVGNIQANEALFRARLDPRRPARTLTAVEVRRLRRGILASIEFTLKQFAAEGADSDVSEIRYVEEPGTPNPFLVYGRAGQRCPRGPTGRAGTIVRIVQAGRSTFYCPACTLAADSR